MTLWEMYRILTVRTPFCSHEQDMLAWWLGGARRAARASGRVLRTYFLQRIGTFTELPSELRLRYCRSSLSMAKLGMVCT